MVGLVFRDNDLSFRALEQLYWVSAYCGLSGQMVDGASVVMPVG